MFGMPIIYQDMFDIYDTDTYAKLINILNVYLI